MDTVELNKFCFFIRFDLILGMNNINLKNINLYSSTIVNFSSH